MFDRRENQCTYQSRSIGALQTNFPSLDKALVPYPQPVIESPMTNNHQFRQPLSYNPSGPSHRTETHMVFTNPLGQLHVIPRSAHNGRSHQVSVTNISNDYLNDMRRR